MGSKVKVKVLNGDVGPSVQPSHWRYRPYQKRIYSDGLIMFLEYSTATIDGRNDAPMRIRGTVWIEQDGTLGESHSRAINSPSDIGALLNGFRRGLRKLGLYGDHGVWDEDGRRLTIGSRPYIRSVK